MGGDLMLGFSPMIPHLFVFEPKDDLVRKIVPIWENHFVIQPIADFQAMEAALLSENAGVAVILFNWDKWTDPLQYLQQIRVWHRLIPIVIVATTMPHVFCIAAMRDQTHVCLRRPFVPARVRPVLDAIFDDYDRLSLRNMYYLSIRQRKFVFNKTLRYQTFQRLARSLATRDPWVLDRPMPVSAFEIPKPTLLVLDLDPTPVLDMAQAESRYHVLVAEDAGMALQLAADHPEIDLVIMDVVAPGAAEPAFLTALGEALPKAGVLVWTASQNNALAMQCFQIGIFDYESKTSAEVSLAAKVESLLHMKWEMAAGGDIALYTRQFLFAAHCQYAFQQGKPVFWSDWYVFFKCSFPENTTRMASDLPISAQIFADLGVAGLSVLDPDPVGYPDVFVTG
jgi:CheY-like chemotaxis protein